MLSTLRERLLDAMSHPKKITGAALAKACGISAPSVSDWLTGKSKSMDGGNLIDAAEFLGVRAKWLIKGVGPKHPDHYGPAPGITDVEARDIRPKPSYDPWTLEAIGILERMNDPDPRAAVLTLRTFSQQLGPPSDGQALPVAFRK